LFGLSGQGGKSKQKYFIGGKSKKIFYRGENQKWLILQGDKDLLTLYFILSNQNGS